MKNQPLSLNDSVSCVPGHCTADLFKCSELAGWGDRHGKRSPFHGVFINGKRVLFPFLLRFSFVACLVFTSLTSSIAETVTNEGASEKQGADELLDRFFADRFQFAAKLTPSRTFIRTGTVQPAETFPEVLTLQVSEPLSQSTFFSIEKSDDDITVSDVGILAGESSAPVLVSAAETGIYLLAIEVNGVTSEAQVQALSVDEFPEELMVQPGMLTIPTNAQVEFTIAVDIPAPPGGVEIQIDPMVSGLMPAASTIPENQMTQSVPYIAPSEPDTGSIIWTLSGAQPLPVQVVTPVEVVDE